jgi:hypothetical protein
MKRGFIFLLLCLAISNAFIAGTLKECSPVYQNVHYFSQDASEVFLVWNIAGADAPDIADLPHGTYQKDGMFYTPMKNEDQNFFCKLRIPALCSLNYSFWITKGPGNVNIDIKESAHGGNELFHTLITATPILVVSGLDIRPSETLSLLDFSKPLLLIVAFLFLLFVIIRDLRRRGLIKSPAVSKVIALCSSAALLVLFLIRPAMLGISWEFYSHPLSFTPQLLWTGFYDLVYVASLTTIFLLLVAPFRQFPQAQFGLAYLFIAISLFAMIAGIINVRIFEYFGASSFYKFTNTPDVIRRAQSSIAINDNISMEYITGVIVVCLAAIVGGALLTSIIEMVNSSRKVRNVLLVCSTFLCVSYVVVAQEALSRQNWKADPKEDVAAFFGSMSPFSNAATPAEIQLNAKRK